MQFALRPLASGIKMTILLPAPPATKLKPVIPPESGHLGRTTFFACNNNGASGTLKNFRQMNTDGRASSLVGGLEEEVDCGVCGGALTLPLTDFTSLATSSGLGAGGAGKSPTFGSEEEAAMLPSGSERGSSSSKRRGEVDGGRDSGSEAGGEGDSPGFQQVHSFSHPFSGMVPGTRTERSALMMRSDSLMNLFGKRGQSGYLTPAVSGIPTASEGGAESELAHKWAKWLPHPCRIGDPQRFRAGGRIRSGPQVGKVATSPLSYRNPQRFRAGGQIGSVTQLWK